MKRRIALSICFCISIMSCAVENKVPITPQPTKTSSEIIITPTPTVTISPSVIVQGTINPSPSVTPESKVSIKPSATPTPYISSINESPEDYFYHFYGKVCDEKNKFLESVKVTAKFIDPEYSFEGYTASDFYKYNENGIYITRDDGFYMFNGVIIGRNKEVSFQVTVSKEGYKSVTRNITIRGDGGDISNYFFNFGCNIKYGEQEYALKKE